MSEKEREEADKKPRAADFVFTAFVTEWQYRIVPPIGFRVRALPEDKSETLGPAKFSVAYSSDNTGTVLVTIRLNSVKGRYTAQEAESMRTAVRQFRKRDYIAIGFDNIGHALIAQGKVTEGLKEYESIAAQHPKEALHRSQYASAMLDVGLCEAARAQAKKATELDPKSTKAFKELGWILQHDLVCRRLKKGFDFDGAVAAYHKALDLDPEDIYTRADLAILYEHGRDGYQYSPSSQLDDAVAEWKAVRKLDSRVGAKYIDNLLFDLIYAKHWKELQTELAAVSMDPTHRSMALVSTVATDGVAAAIEQSKQITPDEVSRSAALIASGNYLIRLRRYADAAEMLSAGAKGQADSAAALQRADLFRRTKRHEEILLPDADPRSLVQKMMVTTFKNSEDPSLCAMSARLSMQGMTCADARERSRTKRESGQARGQIAKSGLPADVLSDIVLSNLQMTVDGDDKVGYKIMLQPLGAKSSPMYVVKEDEKYVILATESDADDVCAEALVRLDANNEAGARRLLDWLRADTQISGGDDPLAGRLFARMWTRGQEANPDTMRAAALSMVDTREDAGRWIPALIAARDKAKSETNRGYLEAALASAYSKERNWPELRASALRLLTIFPDSNVARSMLGLACYHLKDWETIRKAIEARLSAVPDDPEVERQLADFYSAQGKFEESGVILKKLIDSGRANANDMNSYSWNQLIMGRVTDDGIEQARRAVSLQKSYGIVHTLAAIYAEHGNPQEARQLLLNIMDDYGMDEPDDSLWYVFGRIAEAYEQPQAARSYYQLVRWKEKFEPDPRSTYVLVQKRLKGLLAETAVGAK
jgi:tetratricopeptide (TPR) repeat protein